MHQQTLRSMVEEFLVSATKEIKLNSFEQKILTTLENFILNKNNAVICYPNQDFFLVISLLIFCSYGKPTSLQCVFATYICCVMRTREKGKKQDEIFNKLHTNFLKFLTQQFGELEILLLHFLKRQAFRTVFFGQIIVFFGIHVLVVIFVQVRKRLDDFACCTLPLQNNLFVACLLILKNNN